jgi:Tropinone reductase 1
MWNLRDKKILLTGGTKGIGRASAIALSGLEAELLLTARNSSDLVHGIVADVTDPSDQEKITDWVAEHWRKLDVLVNNAGMNIRKASDAYTNEEYAQIMETNLHAPFKLTTRLLSLLKNSGAASIINVASIAGMMDVKTGSPYGMAKAGLLQMTRSLAVELAVAGIRVNAVSPWFTETPMTKGLIAQEEKMSLILQRTPLKRVAQPLEIAHAICFLAMDKSSYITGQNLVVDGGMSVNAL